MMKMGNSNVGDDHCRNHVHDYGSDSGRHSSGVEDSAGHS